MEADGSFGVGEIGLRVVEIPEDFGFAGELEDVAGGEVDEEKAALGVLGEVAEGLPGSLKSVVCVKRNTRELGAPNSFLAAAR